MGGFAFYSGFLLPLLLALFLRRLALLAANLIEIARRLVDLAYSFAQILQRATIRLAEKKYRKTAAPEANTFLAKRQF